MQNDIYCAPDASYSELPAGPSSTCSVCVSRKDFSHDSLGLDANSPASEMFSHRLVGYSSHVPILPYAPSISRPPRGLYAPFQLNNPAYPRGGRALFSLSPDVHRYSLPVNQETAKECAEHDLQTKRTLQTSATMSSYSEASVSDWEKSNGSREKPRRMRTVFTPQQLERLERHFKGQQYVGSAQRIFIAKQLGLSETQVKVWFQNRRIRWRKQVLGHKTIE